VPIKSAILDIVLVWCGIQCDTHGLSTSAGKRVREVSLQGRFDYRHRWRCVAEQLLHRSDGSAGQATGDDEVEVAEVGDDVEGDAVEGDAAADAHPEGADLAELAVVFDPDANGGRVFLGGDVEVGQGSDNGFFEAVDVRADGEAVVDKADDGVGDDLAGAMKSDVATAVRLDDFDVEPGELFGGGNEVPLDVGPAAEGDDGGMLDEEEVFLLPGGDGGVDLLLEGPGVSVGHGSQVLNDHAWRV